MSSNCNIPWKTFKSNCKYSGCIASAVSTTQAAAPLLSALPQILPNGSSNPLFNAIDNVVAAVNGQTANGTGCPIYCFNVANSDWIVGNPCICK